MKTVKTFTNLAEAGFAASLLESAGIPASLAGEQSFLYVAGIANEGIRLQVEDVDHEQAMRILQEGLDGPPPPPSTEKGAEESRTPVGLFIAAVAAFALLGLAVYQAREEERTRAKRIETQTYEQDYNGDGRPDHFYTYRQGVLVRGEADRNFDGKIDEWETFDQAGRPAHVEQDNNFDGHPDLWYFYEKGDLIRSEQDADFDGKPDHFSVYEHGKLARTTVDRNYDGVIDKWEYCDQEGRPASIELDENFDGRPDLWYFYEKGDLVRSEQDTDFNGKPDWFTTYKDGLPVLSDCRPNGSQVVLRRFIFEHSVLKEEWIDEDGDGKFDYKILHDPFGNVSARTPVDQTK